MASNGLSLFQKMRDVERDALQTTKKFTTAVKGSFGSTPMVRASGFVVSANKVTWGGAQKWLMAIQIRAIDTSSAPDVIGDPYNPNFTFLIESSKDEQPRTNSPVEGDGGDDGKSKSKKQRTVSIRNPNFKGAFRGLSLGIVEAAVYLNKQDGTPNGDVLELKPGMPVDIAGLSLNRAMSKGEDATFLNFQGIPKAATDAITEGFESEALFAQASSFESMKTSFLPLALTVNGCFHMNSLEPSQQVQASAVQRSIVEARDGLVASIDTRAEKLNTEFNERSGTVDKHPASENLVAIADKIKAIPEDRVPTAEYFGLPKRSEDVQQFSATFATHPYDLTNPMPKAIADLFLGNADGIKVIPDQCIFPQVSEVEFNRDSNASLVTIRFDINVVGDKAEFLKAVAVGDDPLIRSSPNKNAPAKLAFKIITRKLIYDVGTNEEVKFRNLLTDMAKFGMFTASVYVTPNSMEQSIVNEPWARAFSINKIPTIRRICVLVDEEMVRKGLDCVDGAIYTYDPDSYGGVRLQDDKNNEVFQPPNFKQSYVCNVNLASQWKFANHKRPPETTGIEYRVWYEGSIKEFELDASGNAILTAFTEVEKGNEAVMKAFKAREEKQPGLSFSDWWMAFTVAFAVAV